MAALIAAPGFLAVARGLSGRIQSAAREMRRRSGSIGAVAEESLSNLALVQAYDRESDEAARYRRENQGAFSAQMVAIRLEALFGPLSDLVELIEVLDEKPAVTDPADPTPLGCATGTLHLQRATFTYPDTERPALSGIDLRISPGEKVAVVGASGAGKTTLTKLLLRFYDPGDGRVTLDGHDLRDLRLSDLRRNVAAVLQETLVFDGTIADNIRWGRPDATDDDVERAARAADVHRFVQDLPDKYATRVGQRGRLLSGGQRQRLAIARAMIRDAPVLLLDEPTTGLDAESTERVLAPLRRLMAGRTTLMISHNRGHPAGQDTIDGPAGHDRSPPGAPHRLVRPGRRGPAHRPAPVAARQLRATEGTASPFRAAPPVPGPRAGDELTARLRCGVDRGVDSEGHASGCARTLEPW